MAFNHVRLYGHPICGTVIRAFTCLFCFRAQFTVETEGIVLLAEAIFLWNGNTRQVLIENLFTICVMNVSWQPLGQFFWKRCALLTSEVWTGRYDFSLIRSSTASFTPVCPVLTTVLFTALHQLYLLPVLSLAKSIFIFWCGMLQYNDLV